ncbi:MAG: tetraacyldisaccharide 4'-kinase [Oceanicoccus sp.]|jgi:tetraacyldisaccharide 4'-kinase
MSSPTLEQVFVAGWYQRRWWCYLLLPFSLLYYLLTTLHRSVYRLGIKSSFSAPVPLIVVGNITVGGTGKTPLVIALVKQLQQAGFKPAVISRGYGSQAPHYPFAVTADSDVAHSGDEPLLIARSTAVPVMIAVDRQAAIQALMASNSCDVIVSDDGLQKHAMARTLEIAVLDGMRGIGNGLLLPAGPLRESVSRLDSVDYIISNGVAVSLASQQSQQVMQLRASGFSCLYNNKAVAVDQWPLGKYVHAIAGIGNPQRFYNSLRELGFKPIQHSFADHYAYQLADIEFDDDLPVLMTEKDAVKIQPLVNNDRYWSLAVEADIDQSFYQALTEQLAQARDKRFT